MKKIFVLLTIAIMAVSTAWAAKRPVPFYLVNNSCFSEDEIYIGIVGQKMYDGVSRSIYYNLTANNAGNSGVSYLNDGLNTLHKTGNDWGYANIFYKMSQLPTLNGKKVVYMDNTFGCRMFIAFKSPMYLHAFADGGYAGADYNNPGDPNYNVRCELIEFTVDWIANEDRNGIWVNTTRVDTFQYPMGLELFGESNATVKYIKTGEIIDYNAVINRWTAQHGSDVYNNCKINNVTTDNLGPIIMQPSKVGAVKSSNIFGNYINNVWNYYKNNTINVTMGVLGRWTGRVEADDTFTLTCQEGAYWKPGSVAKIYGRPSTEDVIEGAGKFASGNDIDKTVQAMFCGAMNRGVIKTTTAHQSWSPTDSRYFNEGNTCNEYVKFFHQTDLSFEGRTYAFAYDDTYDQSATCTTSHADHVVVTIGGFKNAPASDIPSGSGSNNNNNTNGFNVTTAAPAPSVSADKVTSLYSDSYQNVLAGNYGFLEAWGQSSSVAKKSINGNNYLHYSNANWVGWAFNNQNLSSKNTLHLDIYPAASGSLRVLPIHRTGCQDDDIYQKTVNVTAGKWNSIDIPFSDFGDLDFFGISQFKFSDFNGFSEFAVDNVYFYEKSAAAQTTPGVMNGTVQNANFDVAFTASLNNGALTINVTSINNKNNKVGLVPQINVNNMGFNGLTDNGNGTYSFTQNGQFAAGQDIPGFFYFAYAGGVDRLDFKVNIPAASQNTNPGTDVKPGTGNNPGNSDPAYKLVWSDEFNGNALDETRWNIEVNGDGGGNNELQYYSRDGVSVRDGNLVLTAKRQATNGKSFVSGRVNTQGKLTFTYGKIEASIKLPKTYKGLWPAFWTMGNDFPSVGWPSCGELDILEMGEKSAFDSREHSERYMNGACHWNQDGGYAMHSSYNDGGMKGNYYKSVQDGQYHKFTLQWTPELITCYIDDDMETPYFAFANDKNNASVDGTFFSKPYFLIFNLAVGGMFPGIYNANEITAIGPNQGDSQSMYIDYVRVYQREADGGVLIDKAANNVQVTTSTDAHKFQGTDYYVVNLDDNTIKQKLAGKNVVDIRPNGNDRNLYIWENTLTSNNANGTNMYGANGGYVDVTVANNGWYGMGYNVANANLSGITNNSIFHFDLKIPQGGMANFFITVSGVDFKVGTDSDAHLKATINDGKWHSFDIPVSFFGIVPSAMASYSGNIVSVHGYESMQGKSFQLGGIYFYNASAATQQPDPKPSFTAAPVPTVKADRVLSLYSDSYALAPSKVNSYLEGWGQSTKLDKADVNGNNYLSYTNFNYIGWQFSELNASAMQYIHIDVYPKADGMINIVPIYGGSGKTTDDTHKVRLDLKANQWNSFDIPLSQFGSLNFSSIFQMKFDGDGSVKEFCIDNVYFYRVAEVFEDGKAYSGGARTVEALNYKRPASPAGIWTAWYVPFEMSASELRDNGLDAAFINSINEYDDDQNGTLDRTVVEVINLRNGRMQANYPYLVKANRSNAALDIELANVALKAANDAQPVTLSTALVEHTLIGTYQTISQSECNSKGYLVPGITDGNVSGFVAPTNGIKPQSWAMTLKLKNFPYSIDQSHAKKVYIVVIGEEDIETGIRTLYSEENRVVEGVYDLSGRSLSAPAKGVNIINGRKVIVK